MKKIILLVIAGISAISVHSQSKTILQQYGKITPDFQKVIFNSALDANPYNYKIPESQAWTPGTSGDEFTVTLAMLYGWGGKVYFTPTTVVATIARLVSVDALTKSKPNLFLVEVRKGKLTLAIVNFDGTWKYSAISPTNIGSLPKGAVLYTL